MYSVLSVLLFFEIFVASVEATCCSSSMSLFSCCDGNELKSCFMGSGTVLKTCVDPEVCEPNAIPPDCVDTSSPDIKDCSDPDSPVCDGDVAAYCDSSGKLNLGNSIDCSSLGQTCENGNCIGDPSGQTQAFCFEGVPTNPVECTNGECVDGFCNVTEITDPYQDEESCMSKPNGCLDQDTMYYCQLGQKIPVDCSALTMNCVDGKCEDLPGGGDGGPCGFVMRRYCDVDTVVQCVNFVKVFELDCSTLFMKCSDGLCEQSSLFSAVSGDTTEKKSISTADYKKRLEVILGWITGGFGIFTIVMFLLAAVTALTIIGCPLSIICGLGCCCGCCLLILCAIMWPIAYTLIPKVSYDQLTMQDSTFEPFTTLSLDIKFKYALYLTNDAYYDVTVDKVNLNVRKYGRLLATATEELSGSKIKSKEKTAYVLNIAIEMSLFDITEALQVYSEFQTYGVVLFDVDGDVSGDYIGYKWSLELDRQEDVLA